MVSLLKTIGKGFLYVLGFPFFVVALALFGAIGLLAFIFQIIKSIIFFFTGHKFFPELKEDQEVRAIKEANNPLRRQEEPINKPVVDNTPNIITPIVEEERVDNVPVKEEEIITREVTPTKTVEEACFVQDEPLQNLLNSSNELESELQKEPEIESEVEIKEEIKEEPIFEAPSFIAPKEETPVEETKENEEQIVKEETVLDIKEKEKDDDELVEVLETYVPKSSTYSAIESDDDDDNDTDNGVSIDYNL